MKISTLLNFFDVFPNEGRVVWKRQSSPKVKVGAAAGSLYGNGYYYIQLYKKRIKKSRLIFLYVNGYLPKVVDHINGDPSDDRIANLRGCTPSQNTMNSKIREDNSSGFKGISWHKGNKKWHAYIEKGGRRENVGFFEVKEEACDALEERRKVLHGDFARQGLQSTPF